MGYKGISGLHGSQGSRVIGVMKANDQLPVGLLAQLIRALHRYRRGQGSNPGKPDFFRLSFRNCISCVNNCEDLIYI